MLDRCHQLPAGAQAVLDGQFAAGSRVVAIATRTADGQTELAAEDERNLDLIGFVTFLDPPKEDAADALGRLHTLDVEVKVITGDNDRVAAKLCSDLGLHVRGVLTGTQLDQLDDAALATALPLTTIFARVTPDQKSRVIKAQRTPARPSASSATASTTPSRCTTPMSGISVDTATDVAKDAADIVLLAKDLDILAGGVVEGRRIFANTIKYVLMGTSSNFGNMFSAGAASLFLGVPADAADADPAQQPALRRQRDGDPDRQRRRGAAPSALALGHRDDPPLHGLLRADQLALRLRDLRDPALGLRGACDALSLRWFVESLATQSLAIFAIRTHRIPFFRSRPSVPLLASTLLAVAVGVALPFSPLAGTLGFTSLSVGLVAAVAALVPSYFLVLELGKHRFYRLEAARPPIARLPRPHQRRLLRRASRWTVPRRPAAPTRPARAPG